MKKGSARLLWRILLFWCENRKETSHVHAGYIPHPLPLYSTPLIAGIPKKFRANLVCLYAELNKFP